jgi:hypothetical protein
VSILIYLRYAAGFVSCGKLANFCSVCDALMPARTMARNWSAIRLAPPTSAPSTPCRQKQRRGVVRLDAAAVLYGKCLSRSISEDLSEATPNDGVRIFSLLGGGVVFEIADCPDRFVRNAQASQGIPRHVS